MLAKISRGDAVADAMLADQFADKHEQRGARGERDDDGVKIEGAQVKVGYLLAEECRITERLRQSQTYGQIARILRDLVLAGLALPGKLLERRKSHGQQLQNNGGRNIRHDSQGKNRETAERASRKRLRKLKISPPLLLM